MAHPQLQREFRQWLGSLGDLRARGIADALADWFAGPGSTLQAWERFALCESVDWTHVPALGLQGQALGLLQWRLTLLGRVLPAAEIADSAWPPPIQFRVRGLYADADARVVDFVLLYEALIHFHFVILASQFVSLASAPARVEASSGERLGWQILGVALHDRSCMGGKVWLHRAAGLSRVLGSLSALAPPVFPQVHALLQPETLELHPSFSNDLKARDIVRKGGVVFAAFELMQEVRNRLHGHADHGGAIDPDVSLGIERVLGQLMSHFDTYQQCGMAMSAVTPGGIRLACMWTDRGEVCHAHNDAARRRFMEPRWGAGVDGMQAPSPPMLDGWSPGWWDESLLLYDKAAPRSRYLYLMPWGQRSHKQEGPSPTPGLLDSVRWRKLGGQRLPTVIQRLYLDAHELEQGWLEGISGQLQKSTAAEWAVGALAARIQAIAGSPAPDVEAADDVIQDSFDLQHAGAAVFTASHSLQRHDLVQTLFDVVDAAVLDGRGSFVALVGPSGAGKSVLLAQAFTREARRALYFTMDSAPSPALEPLSSERVADAAANEDAPVHDSPATPVGPASTRPASSLVEASLAEMTVADDSLSSASGPGPAADTPFPRGAWVSSMGVPLRMHWLAGAAKLCGRPWPAETMSAPAAAARFRAMTSEYLDARPRERLFVFVDAVNQADDVADLFSGLMPLSALHRRLVVVVSTQDNAIVMRSLGKLAGAGASWRRVDAAPFDEREILELLAGPGTQACGSPPVPAPVLAAVVHQTAGLPILVAHWAERLRAMVASHGNGAFERLLAEIDAADAGSFPGDYLGRLLDEVKRDFHPQQLPQAVMWCLSAVAMPLDREALYEAANALRPLLPPLPPVSRHEIDAALARLGGFVVRDTTGSVARWRLAHPMLGKAWRQEFGTPGLIGGINEALLRHGALPDPATWSVEACSAWMMRSLESHDAVKALSLEQQGALVAGLLDRVPVDQGLSQHLHRMPGLRYLRTILAWRRGEVDEAERECRALHAEVSAAIDGEQDVELRGDRLYDFARIVGGLFYYQWSAGDPARFDTAARQVALLQSIRLAWPGRWSELHTARLLLAMENSAHCHLESESDLPKAMAVLDDAVAIDKGGQAATSELRHALAQCLSLRAFCLKRAGRLDDALADLHRGVDLCRRPSLPSDESRRSLSSLLGLRSEISAELGRLQEAEDDLDAAIALEQACDLRRPRARAQLAGLASRCAELAGRRGDWSKAAAVGRVAFEHYADLEQEGDIPALLGASGLHWARSLKHEGRHAEAASACKRILDLGRARPAGADAEALVTEAGRELAALLRQLGQHDHLLSLMRGHTELELYRQAELGALFGEEADTGASGEPTRLLSQAPGVRWSFEAPESARREWLLDACGFDIPALEALRRRMLVRSVALGFYPGAHLVVLIDPARAARREVFALVRWGQEVRVLDWSNEPIYRSNRDWALDVGDPGLQVAYIDFFFRLIRGRHGRFFLVETIDDVDLAPHADPAQVAALQRSMQGLRAIPPSKPDRVAFVGRMLFRDSLFEAVIEIAVEGEALGVIQLSQEVLLLENLPVAEDAPPWIRAEGTGAAGR